MLGFLGSLYQRMRLSRDEQEGYNSKSAAESVPLQRYQPVGSVREEDEAAEEDDIYDIDLGSKTSERESKLQRQLFRPKTRSQTAIMLLSAFLATLGLVALAQATYLDKRAGSTSAASSSDTAVPQYFQTYPELYAGKLVVFLSISPP